MRRRAALFFWIVGILFPMAWPTRFSTIYTRVFAHFFNPLWTHVLMHAFLFAVLAYLLVHRMNRRMVIGSGRRIILGVLAVVLVIALLQEGIQLLYKARPPGTDEALDVGIDLVGGSLGVIAYGRSLLHRDQPKV